MTSLKALREFDPDADGPHAAYQVGRGAVQHTLWVWGLGVLEARAPPSRWGEAQRSLHPGWGRSDQAGADGWGSGPAVIRREPTAGVLGLQ